MAPSCTNRAIGLEIVGEAYLARTWLLELESCDTQAYMYQSAWQIADVEFVRRLPLCSWPLMPAPS